LACNITSGITLLDSLTLVVQFFTTAQTYFQLDTGVLKVEFKRHNCKATLFYFSHPHFNLTTVEKKSTVAFWLVL
jgi:hypothetical protein